ncbi:aminotransferase class I/II-fold pyridoxal phosphate-dependent enzyme [Maribius pontilimi]|uniref:Aminotransferase n=1 Tax=Palleronia pontilimi TaxID=1964209 RepID=A0A934MBJ4_9RHOB|nr:aminotransferase class I/II-fold pyridoxal phosphate-dependent enzyme [Palleronia pontilimi]MBJ3761778.1 aminotransferase class I/II-fold pyridoxal phosphate-dependent enzyme [Palleronia pontilimi]
MRVSQRGQVDPFIVMDVMERARAAEADGRRIIHMEVGQPGTPAPEGARAALSAAMAAGPLGYTVGLGLPELRARIAQHYGQSYGVDLDPARVVVTAGASGAFILSFTALFEAGERVALGLPGYPSYRHILSALSLAPVGIETTLENRFQPVPSEIPRDVQGLIVASPGNPTGTMLDRPALDALVETCADRDIALISDEIYHGIDYERRPVSALEITDDVHVINSFSKYFSMTGWRVGWMVVPPSHVRMIERLAQNMFICPSHASQVSALAAFDCRDELNRNLSVYAANRRLMIDGLAAAGFASFAPPDGAFYVYVDVSDMTDDALALSAEILEKAGVAVTPGLDFDPRRGGRMLRFSYAGSTEDIAEGLDRLKTWRASRMG